MNWLNYRQVESLPGKYDVPTTAFEKQSFNQKEVPFQSQKERFQKYSFKSYAPGPGQYQNDILNKHNSKNSNNFMSMQPRLGLYTEMERKAQKEYHWKDTYDINPLTGNKLQNARLNSLMNSPRYKKKPKISYGVLKPNLEELNAPSIPFVVKTDSFIEKVGPGSYDPVKPVNSPRAVSKMY